MTNVTRRVLITVTEAAKIHRIPPRTIRRWVTDGRLCQYGHWREGKQRTRRHLIDAAELEELVKLLRGVSLDLVRDHGR